MSPSLHAAAQSDPDLPVSLAALYDKVNRTELELAKKVRPSTVRKHPRAAEKKVKKGYVRGKVARKHVATARVLKGP